MQEDEAFGRKPAGRTCRRPPSQVPKKPFRPFADGAARAGAFCHCVWFCLEASPDQTNRTRQNESRRKDESRRIKTNQDESGAARRIQRIQTNLAGRLCPLAARLCPQIRGNAHKFARIYTQSAVLTKLEQGRTGDPPGPADTGAGTSRPSPRVACTAASCDVLKKPPTSATVSSRGCRLS